MRTLRAAGLATVLVALPSRREADNAAEQAPLRLRQPLARSAHVIVAPSPGEFRAATPATTLNAVSSVG